MDTFWSFATSKTDLILIFIIVVVAVFEVLYSPDPCSASCSSSELWTNSTWGEGQRPFVQCTRIHDVSHVGFIMYLNGEGKLDVIYKFFYLHYRFWVPSVAEEKTLYMSSIITWRFSGRVHRSPRTPSRICPQSACAQPEKISFYFTGNLKKGCQHNCGPYLLVDSLKSILICLCHRHIYCNYQHQLVYSSIMKFAINTQIS